MAVKCTHICTDETCFFWCCPECERAPSKDGWPHLNIGRDHWFFCDTHKRKGWVGSNLFSAWRHESPEVLERNEEKLAGYYGESVLRDAAGNWVSGLRPSRTRMPF